MTGRVVLVLAVVVAVGAAALPAQEAVHLRWENNWNTAFDRARTERRLVFVDFWASWCEPCMEMERKSFPDPRVAEQLQKFVLLKLDVDVRGKNAYGTIALPTYKFFDPWETERLKFIAYQPPEPFARKLERVATAAPVMMKALTSLREKESASGRLLLGQAYFAMWAGSYARDEFDTAEKLAHKVGDVALEQAAQTRAALTWVLDDRAPKSLKLLEKIAAHPVNPECEAEAWLAIGHTRGFQHDKRAAAEAYRHAISVSPERSPLRDEAEVALASLGDTP